MITNYLEKIKSLIEANKKDLYIATIIFLVSITSFGLGRLSVLWPTKEPITITEKLESRIQNLEDNKTTEESSTSFLDSRSQILDSAKGKYVASKNGTAYHYPWCPGALKIKEENKIWFNSKEEAESRGYKPAGNCEGL